MNEKVALLELRKMPNVGPKIAADLLRLGVTAPTDLVGRDPDDLYLELCRLDGARLDPCLRDVFAAVVDYAGGGPARPWWEYSRERKAREGTSRTARRGGGVLGKPA